MIGRKDTGCNPSPDDWKITTRKKTWTPAEWASRILMCYTDLIGAASVYSLKFGINKPDFTESDYMNVIRLKLEESLADFAMRLVWFNDKGAKNISQGGQITNGTDLKYFNLLDGLFKQLDDIITANKSRHISIAENAGTTPDAQIIPRDKIQGYMNDLIRKAPIELRGDSTGKIYMTQCMYDSYYDSLTGTTIESLYTNLTNGIKALTYKGVPVIAVPYWDNIIAAYQNKGESKGVINPNRALYTTKENLAMGLDTEDQFSNFDVWFDKKDKTVIIDMQGNADTKILNDNYLQFAI